VVHVFDNYEAITSFNAIRVVRQAWFIAAGFAGIALAFCAGSALWIRVVARTIQARAEKHADERIRNARECHDILLQEIQGLLLSFHAAAQKVPQEHESRKALEQALASTDRVVVGARDRISRL
jgi:signal transduction histidine kinase